MGQILVRNLDDEVVSRLKKRAKREGRSLQSEVKIILEQAAKVDMMTARDMVTGYRRGLKKRRFSDSARLIREDRKR
jgi:plasmid stability protein